MKRKNVLTNCYTCSKFIYKWYIFLFFFFFFLAPRTFAQTYPQGVLTVFPSIVHLDLSIDQPEYILTYRNTTKYLVELSFTAQDFSDLEEGWKLKFLTPKEAENYKYKLSSWVKFDRTSLSLLPQEEGSIKVFIDKDRLPIGGHYAMILAEMVEKEKKGISVKGKIASLLFVRTATGKEKESAKISTFDAIRDRWEFPTDFVVRIINEGDVELIPHGILEVKDASGEIIAKTVLNQESLITLPESLKRYNEKVTVLKRFLFPGYYSATITVKYGKSNKVVKDSIVFFSQGHVPIEGIGISVIIGGVIFLLWKNFRSQDR